MGKSQYYKHWLGVSFRHSIDISDGVAFLIGIVVPIIRQVIPDWDSIMSELAWQLPLGVFSTVILFRLILAPYWIHKDKEKQMEVITQEKAKLEQQLDDKTRRKQVKDALGIFLSEGKQLLETAPLRDDEEFEQKATAWANRVANYILEHFDEGEKANLLNDSGMESVMFNLGRNNYEFSDDRVKNYLNFRSQRLGELISRIPLDVYHALD